MKQYQIVTNINDNKQNSEILYTYQGGLQKLLLL